MTKALDEFGVCNKRVVNACARLAGPCGERKRVNRVLRIDPLPVHVGVLVGAGDEPRGGCTLRWRMWSGAEQLQRLSSLMR